MSKTIDQLRAELDTLYKANDRTQLEHFFTEEALEHAPGCCSVSDEYIFLLNEAGSYYRSVSRFGQSISAYLGLLRTFERFGLDHNAAYPTVLNNLAGSYRMAGDYPSAEEAFLRSLTVYEALGEEHSFGYASALNNLSLCYQASGQYEKALEYQSRAIERVKALALNDETLAASYSNIANIYFSLNRQQEADEAVGQAISLLEQNGHTDTPAYTGALHTRACFNARKGRLEDAAQGYLQVMERTRRQFGCNADYSSAAKGAAMACHDLGDLPQALLYAGQAAESDCRLFGSDSPRSAATAALLAQYRKEARHEI